MFLMFNHNKMAFKKSKRVARRRRSRSKKVTRKSAGRIARNNVMRMAETKIAHQQVGMDKIAPSIDTGDFMDLVPSVPMGTGQGTRIGHKISPVKLVLRGVITYRTNDSANNGCHMYRVRKMIFADRTNSSRFDTNTNDQILNVGGTSVPFNGTLLRSTYPHNNDGFRFYYDKTYTVVKPWGLSNQDTILNSSSVGTTLTSEGKNLCHAFTVVIPKHKLPKVLKFDVNTGGTYPVNFDPVFTIGYADALGYSIEGDGRFRMEGIVTLYYKDM